MSQLQYMHRRLLVESWIYPSEGAVWRPQADVFEAHEHLFVRLETVSYTHLTLPTT